MIAGIPDAKAGVEAFAESLSIARHLRRVDGIPPILDVHDAAWIHHCAGETDGAGSLAIELE